MRNGIFAIGVVTTAIRVGDSTLRDVFCRRPLQIITVDDGSLDANIAPITRGTPARTARGRKGGGGAESAGVCAYVCACVGGWYA